MCESAETAVKNELDVVNIRPRIRVEATSTRFITISLLVKNVCNMHTAKEYYV